MRKLSALAGILIAALFSIQTSFAATNFPGAQDDNSVLGVAVTGQPVASSHHNNLKDAMLAVEAKLGSNASSVPSSIDYLLKNPASVDPGHFHTAASIIGMITANSVVTWVNQQTYLKPISVLDQNNTGVNLMSIMGNAAGTTPAVDCAHIGLTKQLTLANTNKTDTEASRIWQYCYGQSNGPIIPLINDTIVTRTNNESLSNKTLVGGTNTLSGALTITELASWTSVPAANNLFFYAKTGDLLCIRNSANVESCFAPAITSLNGLITPVQTFAVGLSGTDFNIVSSGSTHTFNIPNASATNRGVVTTGTQVFAGVKTFSNIPIISDQNTGGVNIHLIVGNSGLGSAPTCAANGVPKNLGIVDTSNQASDASRVWQLCLGTSDGLHIKAAAPPDNNVVNAATGGLTTCGDAGHSCTVGVDSNGTLTLSNNAITAGSAGGGLASILSNITQSNVSEGDLTSIAQLPLINYTGRVYRFTTFGTVNLTTTDNFSYKVLIGSTVVCSTGAISTTSGLSGKKYKFNGILTVRSQGSSGTVKCSGNMVFDDPASSTGTCVGGSNSGNACSGNGDCPASTCTGYLKEEYIDDDSVITMDLTGQPSMATHVSFSVASSSNNITEKNVLIEQQDPTALTTTTTTTTSTTTTTGATTTTTTTTTTSTTTTTLVPEAHVEYPAGLGYSQNNATGSMGNNSNCRCQLFQLKIQLHHLAHFLAPLTVTDNVDTGELGIYSRDGQTRYFQQAFTTPSGVCNGGSNNGLSCNVATDCPSPGLCQGSLDLVNADNPGVMPKGSYLLCWSRGTAPTWRFGQTQTAAVGGTYSTNGGTPACSANHVPTVLPNNPPTLTYSASVTQKIEPIFSLSDE